MKDDIIEDLNDRIKSDLNWYVLKICTPLDPRFKKLKVISEKNEREIIWTSLEKELRDILKAKQIVDDNPDTVGEEDLSVKRRKIGLDFSESLSDCEDDAVDTVDAVDTSIDPIKQEYQNYRKEPGSCRVLDPMDIWKKLSNKYPLM